MTGWRIVYTIFPLEYRRYFLNTTLYTFGTEKYFIISLTADISKVKEAV